MSVPDILKQIIDVKRDELEALKWRTSLPGLRARAADAPAPRGFLNALKRQAATNGVALIAEVKKASPSKGIIRADFDPVWIATRYAGGGAACLSVLTDEKFFQGSLEYLVSIHQAVDLPIIRKDFIIDEMQILEARAAGADAILLIAACLDPERLFELHRATQDLGMDALVEIHDKDEYDRLLAAGAFSPPLIGINNRNLRTFDVTLETTRTLGPLVVERQSFLVAESGIFTPTDVAAVREAGAKAILVGESLMKQPDPGEAARTLMA